MQISCSKNAAAAATNQKQHHPLPSPKLQSDLPLQLASHTIFQLFSNCQALNRGSNAKLKSTSKSEAEFQLQLQARAVAETETETEAGAQLGAEAGAGCGCH